MNASIKVGGLKKSEVLIHTCSFSFTRDLWVILQWHDNIIMLVCSSSFFVGFALQYISISVIYPPNFSEACRIF